MKKIKILHVIAGLGNGGAERQLIELIKFKKHHGVLLLTDAGVYKDTLDSLKIKYWQLDSKNKFLVIFKMFKFFKIIKSFEPDIIQSWMYNACIFSTFYKLLNIKKVKLIWCIRCSNMIAKYYSHLFYLIIFACKLLSTKADKIVYNSNSGMNYHTALGFSTKQPKVIHNGVDEKNFCSSDYIKKKLRIKYSFRNSDRIIIFVARVDPMKNHETFLRAFHKAKKTIAKNVKLVLVGKGTNLLDLPDDCISLGMKLDIEKYYSMADFIILPSLFGEGFSNVLVEGMLTKLFPIATNVGDAKYIIGKNGIILSNPNEKNFLKVLKKISKSDKNFIKETGIKARDRAVKLFSSKIMIKHYEKLYREVLEETDVRFYRNS